MTEARRKVEMEMEDVCLDFQYAVNALDAVHTAMEYGPFTAESFIGALHLVLANLLETQTKLQNLLKQEETK